MADEKRDQNGRRQGKPVVDKTEVNFDGQSRRGGRFVCDRGGKNVRAQAVQAPAEKSEPANDNVTEE